jgi:hypothetical protein
VCISTDLVPPQTRFSVAERARNFRAPTLLMRRKIAVSVSQVDHSQVTVLFVQFTKGRYKPAWWSNPNHPVGQVRLADREQKISRLFENGHESIDIAHLCMST